MPTVVSVTPRDLDDVLRKLGVPPDS
jgi:hypothetical protein